MLDARYLAFATISALLVMSPGATMAVVMETAIERGRGTALYTVLGVNVGNATLALASALGMSFVFTRWPPALEVVKVGGAGYLAFLGIRALVAAWRGRGMGEGVAAARRRLDAMPRGNAVRGRARSAASGIARGVATNLLNPPVILFYTTFLPQFIGPTDPFVRRFLLLAATHVSMSLGWLSLCAVALGALADRMARPIVRRTLEAATGLLLVGFGVRLLLG